jgi:ribosomal protein S18 acetylase RimI-like enzyme
MIIRDFRYQDLQPVTQLYAEGLADENQLVGLSPEAAIRQVRLFTRGRMIPVKVLTRLMGIQWGALVAEVDGQVVGVGGYIGDSECVALGPLVVLPAYRRRGIGQALLEVRLQRVARSSCKLVTASILENNEAALGNLRKQGFREYSHSAEFEAPLPLSLRVADRPALICHRRAIPEDRTKLEALERDNHSAEQIEIEGSEVPKLYPSWSTRLLSRLYGQFNGRQAWDRVFEKEGQVVGFVRAMSEVTFAKGLVPVLVVAHNDPYVQQAMLLAAAEWFTGLSKQAIRVTVAGNRKSLDFTDEFKVAERSVSLVRRL